jgi:hypothetical protein
VEVLMQHDVFWAVVLGWCLIALALIVIPNDAGVLKDRKGNPAAQRSRTSPTQAGWTSPRPWLRRLMSMLR